MNVEFTLGDLDPLNVVTMDYFGYLNLIEELRRRLGVRYSHNRPVLAVQHNPPTRFFDLILRTNHHSVRFRFRSDNLYLVGYVPVDENNNPLTQWLEFDNWSKDQQRVHYLITRHGTNFLGFGGGYDALANAADQSIDQMRVGVHRLRDAIDKLAETQVRKIRAHSIVVVIMMISEATRLIPVFNYMAQSFDNMPGTSRATEGRIQHWITDLVHAWDSMSAALLRADDFPGQPFQFRQDNRLKIPPSDVPIKTIEQATEVLGILLGLRFTPSGERIRTQMVCRETRLEAFSVVTTLGLAMSAISILGNLLGLSITPTGERLPRHIGLDEQLFIGAPLFEVFSVQINNIVEIPGKLYGTITIDNGLCTQYIYNRTGGKDESVRPGHNITLTGPSESVSAFGNVTIKLLLTDDKNKISRDRRGINPGICWHAANIGDVYDELISQKIDSIIGSPGSVTVNYAVLQNAVAAMITVSLIGEGRHTARIYGGVSACYGEWVDLPGATIWLFDIPSEKNCVKVKRGENIPLFRCVVAVPMNDSLRVTASLHDHNVEIANGTVEFPVQEIMPAKCHKEYVNGRDGNGVRVTIDWSSGF